MPSTMLARLRATEARLEAERSQLDADLEGFRRVIAFYERQGEGTAKRVPAEVLREGIYDILTQEGQPLHYTTIYARLVEEGIRPPGINPERNIGSHLSADPRFEPLGKGMWGLNEWKRAQERAAA